MFAYKKADTHWAVRHFITMVRRPLGICFFGAGVPLWYPAETSPEGAGSFLADRSTRYAAVFFRRSISSAHEFYKNPVKYQRNIEPFFLAMNNQSAII